ncbi:hypothetical protein CLOP_g657 [Closterium sp. NIES-67]|nr:hypothetical protein CLOP_g657 [Closterium sp. NIES-67]
MSSIEFMAMPLDRSFTSASQKPASNSTFSRAQPAMLLQQLSRDPVQREEQLGVLLQDRPAGAALPAWLLAHTNPAAAAAAGALRARPAADYAYPNVSPSSPLPPLPRDIHNDQVLFRPTAIRASPTSGGADEARADELALRGEMPGMEAQGKKRRFAEAAAEEEEVNSSHRKSPLRSSSKRPAFNHAAEPVASRFSPNEETLGTHGAPSSALQSGAALSLAERLARYDQLTVSLRSSLPHGNLSKWDVAVGRLRERVAQKPEFGSNVNQFLVFLHNQLRGSQQPSARAALHQFAALMRAKCQQNQEQSEDGNQSGAGVTRVAQGMLGASSRHALNRTTEGLGTVECDGGALPDRKVELQWLLR